MLIPTPNPQEEHGDDDVLIYTDANWAQDTRVSCGIIFCRGVVLLSCVRRQSMVALSSGELSGVRAAVVLRRHCTRGPSWTSWATLAASFCLWTARPRRAFGSRQGVGKLRHLATKTLWLQQKISDNMVRTKKVSGPENPSDLGAKVHDGPCLAYLRELAGLVEWT